MPATSSKQGREIQMAKITLVHERGNCIGCGACAAIAPGHFQMGADGRADMLGCADGSVACLSKEVAGNECAVARQAAQTCPVNVIHIEENGKREI
ncbi:MAG: ferredoxin [Candidatus Micrarchaeia archaeon]